MINREVGVLGRRELLRGSALAAAAALSAGGGAGAGMALGATPAWARAGTARRYSLGRSHGDRPIFAYRLGPKDASNRFVVLGQMHGDEPAGFRVARGPLLDLEAPDDVQLWVIPTMNPDGRAKGTRTNARGVDLNRNFPSDDWRLQGQGTRYYSGPAPASERETRLVRRFLDDLRPRTVVSIHQPLRCVDYSGGDRSVSDWLGEQLGLPVKKLGASGGNLTTWFNDAFPRRTAVTLELMQPTTAAYRRRTARVLVRLAARRRQ